MKKYAALREKAKQLRAQGWTLQATYTQLGVPKATVWYWIKDVPLPKKSNHTTPTHKKEAALARKKATKKMQEKYKTIHTLYRNEAIRLWEENLQHNVEFKFFLLAYSCEGSKGGRGIVFSNSDPELIAFATKWFKYLNFSGKTIRCYVTIYDHHDKDFIVTFWRKVTGLQDIRLLDGASGKFGKLRGRHAVLQYGTARIDISSSYTKTMVDTWMELFKKELAKTKIPSVLPIDAAVATFSLPKPPKPKKKKHPKQPPVQLICANPKCKKPEFTRNASAVNTKKARGQENFYCCRNCMGEHFSIRFKPA